MKRFSLFLLVLFVFASCDFDNPCVSECCDEDVQWYNGKYLVRYNSSSEKVAAWDTGYVAGIKSNVYRNNRKHERPKKYMGDGLYRKDNELLLKSLSDFRKNPEYSPPVLVKEISTNYKVGEKKLFYVDKKHVYATLKYSGEKCLVWHTEDFDSVVFADNMCFEQLSKKFDEIYEIETDLFGTNKNYLVSMPDLYITEIEDKVSIVVTRCESDVNGYFACRDLLKWSNGNHLQMFYIDSKLLKKNKNEAFITLVHEFQHLLGFIHDKVVHNIKDGYECWYTEMLSCLSEDILLDCLGGNQWENAVSLLYTFKRNYNYGVTCWYDYGEKNTVSYAVNYAFAAYLFRNYGGADFLKSLTHSNYSGKEAVTFALEANGYNFTFDDVVENFYQVLINTLPARSEDELTLNREIRFTSCGRSFKAQAINLRKLPICRNVYDRKNPCFFSAGIDGQVELGAYGFALSKIGDMDENELDISYPDNKNVKIFVH